ncbi:hypothetical protein [Streptomyces sp. 049-1]|uniref:hypothetical protein n=1 Tax=Streptomyces sp. 049-1 TaxID=2789264 RepID=UPI00397EDDC2
MNEPESTAQEEAQPALFEAIASQAREQMAHKDHGEVAAALKDLAEACAWAANQHMGPDGP